MPELGSGLQAIARSLGTPDERDSVQQVWSRLKTETIDYGVMEGAERVGVIPAAGLGWNDVGSWDSLFEVLEGDANGNIIMGGEHVGLDTNKSLIYVNQPHRLIVTIGVEDLVVVDTGDVLLVCHKQEAQRVRQVVNQLKQTGREYV
jgi:mannose-1-phosphate guanylyltransferase